MSAQKSPAAVRMTADLLTAPDKTKDVRIGAAVIPWGWDNAGRDGWRLPGRVVTKDYMQAIRAAEIMAGLMA